MSPLKIGDTIGKPDSVEVEITEVESLAEKVQSYRGKISALGSAPSIDGLKNELEVRIVETRHGLYVVLTDANFGHRIRQSKDIQSNSFYSIPSTSLLFGIGSNGEVITAEELIDASNSAENDFGGITVQLAL